MKEPFLMCAEPAVRPSMITAEQTGSIVHRRVTGKGINMMESDMFMGLLGYKSAMKQARDMVEKELITADEYTKIEEKMREMFGINISSLYRENDWINTRFRGNMSPNRR